ncbi:MAG TPA: queuosine precursor transporter [Syntrophomonadaceae bacterium]|nr:queuosine precursor transporter [Syntrophomonadaceae bacterium]
MQEKTSPQISVPFMIITCLFVTCLLITNIVAGRLIYLFGMNLTADLFLFPITYIFGDVLTEVYGFKKARLTIWLGFAANLLMSVFFMIIITLPYPEFWQHNNAYNTVLGFTPRLVAASLTAYFIGEFSNSIVLSKMKILTQGRHLWARTIGSTIVGQGLDTFVFMLIAFSGLYSWPIFFSMVLAQYLWKVGYEVLATPLTYLFVGWLKKKEGIDTFDKDVSYNPFQLGIREQS